jgi:hypothetical protein
VPLRQICLRGHLLPHDPQWAADFWLFVSQPFVTSPSQLPKPVWQVSMTQTPPAQCTVLTFGSAVQSLPTLPQLWTSSGTQRPRGAGRRHRLPPPPHHMPSG